MGRKDKKKYKKKYKHKKNINTNINTMINIIQKITQILILGSSLTLPWLLGWDIVLNIFLNVVTTLIFLHSELAEIFFGFESDKNNWILTFKLLSPPKQVIKIDENKKYWIDIISRRGKKYVVIYKRFFPFWTPVRSEKVSIYDDSDLVHIEKRVNSEIDSYEFKLSKERTKKEEKKGSKLRFGNWDGLIGDEREKKVYRRGEKLNKLLQMDEEDE